MLLTDSGMAFRQAGNGRVSVFDGGPPADDQVLVQVMEWLFRELTGASPLFVVILDSPIQCAVARKLLSRITHASRGMPGLLQTMRKYIDARLKRLSRAVFGFELAPNYGPPIGLRAVEVRSPLMEHVERSVIPLLDKQLQSFNDTPARRLLLSQWNVETELERREIYPYLQHVDFTNNGLGTDGDVGRVVHYSWLLERGAEPDAECEALLRLIAAGLWSAVLLDEGAILCRRPRSMHVDERGYLHSLQGPAHEWEDGVKEYRVHGVRIAPEFLFGPRDVPVAEILQEPNVERRRVMLDLIDRERLVSEADVIIIDRDVDGANQPRRLFQIDIPSELNGFTDYERWMFVEVRCPSTGHVHLLRVPPEIRECARAVAWTFNRDVSEYAPAIET